MIKLPIEEAIGKILAHDMTRIVPGEFKGPAFKKGHIIRQEDIPQLRRMGKNHVYIHEFNDSLYHEDEAAQRIAVLMAGEGLTLTAPAEGRVNLKASLNGMLRINREVLFEINSHEAIIISTLHDYTPLTAGQIVAGTRIIPLTMPKERITAVEEILKASGPIVTLAPTRSMKAGIVVTGSEVYSGLIEDRFGPVLSDKVDKYGGEQAGILYAPDDAETIAQQIQAQIQGGAEIVLVSGGMSVDPDDVTPKAIASVSDRIVTYGAPVLPGAMFMLAYAGAVPILGIPGCGMYRKITIFDLIFPRLLAGITVERKDIIELGHGGLCLGCAQCTWPVCPFGKP